MNSNYDLMVLIDSEISEDERAAKISESEKLVEAAGGKLQSSESWGNRKLAYEIDHRKDATYQLIKFDADTSAIADLGSKLRILDGVLRFRIIDQSDVSSSPAAAEPATAV